ncbi:unnamed protein product [Rotaria sp. Silwood2]|nr:unnamed protein product [Rotaria sp. Silwood2]CAF4311752.1 unnamed protein product [Rotaria sp. Silwood2]
MSAYGESQLLSIGEIADLLNVKADAATKWLKTNGIHIHKFCKTKHVFRFDVHVVLGIAHARGLKLEFPNDWQERYRLSQSNPSVSELVFKELNAYSNYQPTTRVIALTESDNKLISKLKQHEQIKTT